MGSKHIIQGNLLGFSPSLSSDSNRNLSRSSRFRPCNPFNSWVSELRDRMESFGILFSRTGSFLGPRASGSTILKLWVSEYGIEWNLLGFCHSELNRILSRPSHFRLYNPFNSWLWDSFCCSTTLKPSKSRLKDRKTQILNGLMSVLRTHAMILRIVYS